MYKLGSDLISCLLQYSNPCAMLNQNKNFCIVTNLESHPKSISNTTYISIYSQIKIVWLHYILPTHVHQVCIKTKPHILLKIIFKWKNKAEWLVPHYYYLQTFFLEILFLVFFIIIITKNKNNLLRRRIFM